MSDEAQVPHFAFPLRFESGGGATVVEQDTPEEITQCVEVLLRTHDGTRIEVPEYGVSDFAFRVDVDRSLLLGEVERWEPRARVVFEDDIDRLDALARNIRVSVES